MMLRGKPPVIMLHHPAGIEGSCVLCMKQVTAGTFGIWVNAGHSYRLLAANVAPEEGCKRSRCEGSRRMPWLTDELKVAKWKEKAINDYVREHGTSNLPLIEMGAFQFASKHLPY